MAGLSTFQSGLKGSKFWTPKGSEMVNLDVFDHLEPFWVGVDPIGPFQTRDDFFLKSTSAKPYFVLMGQQIDFCLKWIGPKGSQIVKNI